VIQWNESSQLAQKCNLCAQLIDSGEKTTRCVETCPTQAMIFGDLDDPNSAASHALQEKAGQYESYKPEFGTKPAVNYFGLPRPFIVGEVLLADRPGECAHDAKVTLIAKTDGKVMSSTTDFLGDFEFKGLTVGAEYSLRAECEGYRAKQMTVRADKSVNVGEVVLEIV
jgi:hypothetical protein